MKIIKTAFLGLLINLLLSIQLYSQDKIDPKCLKVLKYINEYNFPVNTTDFEGLFKKDFYPDGAFSYDMDLNDTTIFYLYSIVQGNLTKGMLMRGKDITFDYLQYNHIAVGYSICDNCIMVYYIGAVPETDNDIALNVEYLKFDGEKIILFFRDQIIKNNEILSAYFFDDNWITKTAVIEECSSFKTKVVLNDDDERREEYYAPFNVNIETGEVAP